MPKAEAQAPDSGAATIWAALAVGALTILATLAIWLAATVIARHQAESAADLGALAAASHASEGPARACERARWIADRMRVTLRSCTWQQLDALVEVEARGPALPGLPQPSAHARAGPAAEPPPHGAPAPPTGWPPPVPPTGEPSHTPALAPTGEPPHPLTAPPKGQPARPATDAPTGDLGGTPIHPLRPTG
ncbi:Rv3654c family TadE-like protein [Amycolatopsis tolypomycina]|uniref:Rv3654c family TadE-like protein n=1 Tax=Amycolatopsis tolypomycina TaxID=208445 RepID=UPI0033ABC5A2